MRGILSFSLLYIVSKISWKTFPLFIYCFKISWKTFSNSADDKVPENVSSCTLANDDGFMSYYLTGEGVISLRKMLYVLSYLHPDITFCPILQQVAAIFLHFMEDVWCFACISAMLSGKKLYFEQTHGQAAAVDSAFAICAMTTIVSAILGSRSSSIPSSPSFFVTLLAQGWLSG